MAELMGICGADAETARRVLDRMQANVDCRLGLRVDRHEARGIGLLRFHHGVINPHRQPVTSEDGSLLAAMDGELYGTGRLRAGLVRRGHALRSPGSDAELVLHLFQEKGERAFVELCGSFCLAIYETRSRRLTLATDRFFSRPLYWCRLGEALVFASRFNALVASGALDGGTLDVTAAMQLFTFQHVQHRRTHYREARAMAAASVLRFGDGRVAEARYWHPTWGGPRLRREEWEERLADALRAAARRMTADRARHGVLLSGGVDSRTFLAACEEPGTAFTAGDSVTREVRVARRVARMRGWPHVFLRRTEDHYADLLDEAVELTGGMGRFDHCHFLGHLEELHARCDVAFVEEPMDPLFEGWYWGRRLRLGPLDLDIPGPARFTHGGIEEQILRMPAKSLFALRPWLLFREPWRSRYRDVMVEDIRRQLADAGPRDPCSMAEHVGGLLSPGRPGAFANVTCLRPGLEYRSVCFDNDLLDLAFAMPPRYKREGRVFLGALKRLSPRLHAIPHANTGLRPETPAWVGWSCQQAGRAVRMALRRLGVGLPWETGEAWPDRAKLLRRSRLRGILERTVRDGQCLPTELFDGERIETLLRAHVSGRRNYMHTLLLLLTFGRWFRKYGPRNV